jgi:hypothetical protein
MHIEEHKGDGPQHYEVTLTERRVEELRALQKYDRRDEIPFRAVARLSELNSALYETLVHPVLAACVPPEAAKLARQFHPLRMQRWAFSDLNPAMAPIGGMAQMAAASRVHRDEAGPSVAAEHVGAAIMRAGLDFYRQMRDAAVENLFFNTYSGISETLLREPEATAAPAAIEEDKQTVKDALARIEEGGPVEATVRMVLLAAKRGKAQRQLSTMKRIRELVGADAGLLDLPVEKARTIIRDQSLIVDYQPDEALRTLPRLLPSAEDRRHVLGMLDKMTENLEVTPAQTEFASELHRLLAPPLEVVEGTKPQARQRQ